MNTTWDELVREHITGESALAMSDTACSLDANQMRRLVPGYILKRDLQMDVRSTWQ